MVSYYKLRLVDTVKYYLVEGDDAVYITVQSDGETSTVGTHDSIMGEVRDATEVSESDLPDGVAQELQRGADDLDKIKDIEDTIHGS